MIRLVYVIALSFPIVLYYILKSHYVVKHMEKYSVDQRYHMAQRMIVVMKKNGRIITDVYGKENLPAEGGYDNNKNTLTTFLPGTFKCSIRSKTPIIPVALKDSYKVFGVNSLKKIHTEVHFLKPLYYEEYQNLNTIQIAELVKSRIEEVLGTAA